MLTIIVCFFIYDCGRLRATIINFLPLCVLLHHPVEATLMKISTWNSFKVELKTGFKVSEPIEIKHFRKKFCETETLWYLIRCIRNVISLGDSVVKVVLWWVKLKKLSEINWYWSETLHYTFNLLYFFLLNFVVIMPKIILKII